MNLKKMRSRNVALQERREVSGFSIGRGGVKEAEIRRTKSEILDEKKKMR